jgi:hypothetical protein
MPTAGYKSEIFLPRWLLGVERGKRKLAVHADNARAHTAKVTTTFCDEDFLRIASHPPDPFYSSDVAPSGCFLVSSLAVSKTASKDSNSSLQMNFFCESEKFWTKSALAVWKPFSGSGSTDRTDALRQMESTWNEANNGPLSDS